MIKNGDVSIKKNLMMRISQLGQDITTMTKEMHL